MMNYKKGGKPCKIEDSKKVVDPRSETSFRGKSYLAVGNKQPVKAVQTFPPTCFFQDIIFFLRRF